MCSNHCCPAAAGGVGGVTLLAAAVLPTRTVPLQLSNIGLEPQQRRQQNGACAPHQSCEQSPAHRPSTPASLSSHGHRALQPAQHSTHTLLLLRRQKKPTVQVKASTSMLLLSHSLPALPTYQSTSAASVRTCPRGNVRFVAGSTTLASRCGWILPTVVACLSTGSAAVMAASATSASRREGSHGEVLILSKVASSWRLPTLWRRLEGNRACLCLAIANRYLPHMHLCSSSQVPGTQTFCGLRNEIVCQVLPFANDRCNRSTRHRPACTFCMRAAGQGAPAIMPVRRLVRSRR